MTEQDRLWGRCLSGVVGESWQQGKVASRFRSEAKGNAQKVCQE